MKIWSLKPREDWIIDEIVTTWNTKNFDIVTQNPENADVIWLAADFAWRHVPLELLRRKKVVTTIHHIVPEKWNNQAACDFRERDEVTDVYHVPNRYTEAFVRSVSDKPICRVPYWANQDLWSPNLQYDRHQLRQHHGLAEHDYVVMSAQRDTEGHDLKTAKREKGPDLLADALIELNIQRSGEMIVLLGGWRRQYLIGRLSDAGIRYKYVERPPVHVVRDMYQMSDLYLVTSRHEGGPQALIECGLMNLLCASRPVGMAADVLTPTAINDDVMKATPEIPDVSQLLLPHGFQGYRAMFQSLV